MRGTQSRKTGRKGNMAQENFDFIVTGAGRAGPADPRPRIPIPLGVSRTYIDPVVNWKFESAPQPTLDNRRLYLPRGKTLGGTSSINGMVYIRGNHADYDDWRQRGCTGWDWDSVLPHFKKAENQTRGPDEFHRTGGPLH